MIVGIDIDDTSLYLVPTWINWYNKDYNDNLTVDQITDWDISLFVKKECGKKIYKYIDNPKIYDEVLPVEDVLWGTDLLRCFGHTLLFNSVSSVKDAKYDALVKYNIFKKGDEFAIISNKDRLKLDWLIDDNLKNIINRGKSGILMNRPWNKKFVWNPRASNWKEVIKIICSNIELKINEN